MSQDKRHAILASIVASAALFATGCCCSLDLGSLFTAEEDEPSESTPGVDLGVATYPASASGLSATKHAWRDRRLDPDVYRAGYALSPEEQTAASDALRDLAVKLRYKDEGEGKFKWVPPAGCDKDMRCVLESLAESSKLAVDPLAERFKKRIKEANLSTMDAVELVTSFVQAIPYEIPKGSPFGLLPPALVASQKKGDCDSKALLLLMLLDSLGVDSVMLNSTAHRHSMLGVAVPAQGDKITYKGRTYAFVETTAKGAPIGWISKDLLKPNDWVVVPVKVSAPEPKGKSESATGKVGKDDEPPQKQRPRTKR